MLQVQVCYSVVTFESSLEGEYSEEGIEREYTRMSLEDIVDLIQDTGIMQESEYPSRGTGWYITADGTPDYKTGDMTYRSVHLTGSRAMQRALNRALWTRRLITL